MLTDLDRQKIADAVAAAEMASAGEIVTIITPQSDTYRDVGLAWSITIAFLALAALELAPTFYLSLIDRAFGLWGHTWKPQAVLGIALSAAVIKFLAMLLLMEWRPLRLFLTPSPIKSARVHARALTCFRVGAQGRTTGHTGILIYLSMAERRAEIIADEAIASKVTPEVWGEAMHALLTEIRAGRIADGMVAAVAQVGQVLALHLPRAIDDSDELPNRLIEV
jgi:putative membrane protein